MSFLVLDIMMAIERPIRSYGCRRFSRFGQVVPVASFGRSVTPTKNGASTPPIPLLCLSRPRTKKGTSLRIFPLSTVFITKCNLFLSPKSLNLIVILFLLKKEQQLCSVKFAFRH